MPAEPLDEQLICFQANAEGGLSTDSPELDECSWDDQAVPAEPLEEQLICSPTNSEEGLSIDSRIGRMRLGWPSFACRADG